MGEVCMWAWFPNLTAGPDTPAACHQGGRRSVFRASRERLETTGTGWAGLGKNGGWGAAASDVDDLWGWAGGRGSVNLQTHHRNFSLKADCRTVSNCLVYNWSPRKRRDRKTSRKQHIEEKKWLHVFQIWWKPTQPTKSVNAQLDKYKEYTTKYIMPKYWKPQVKRKPYKQPAKNTILHTGKQHHEKLPSSHLKQWRPKRYFYCQPRRLYPVKGNLQKNNWSKTFSDKQ